MVLLLIMFLPEMNSGRQQEDFKRFLYMVLMLKCVVCADAIKCYTGNLGQFVHTDSFTTRQPYSHDVPGLPFSVIQCTGSCFASWDSAGTVILGCSMAERQDGCHSEPFMFTITCYCNSDFCIKLKAMAMKMVLSVGYTPNSVRKIKGIKLNPDDRVW